MDEERLARPDNVGSDRLRSVVLHQLRSLLLVVEGPQHRILVTNRAYLDLLDGFDPVGLPLAEVFGGAEGQGALHGLITSVARWKRRSSRRLTRPATNAPRPSGGLA